MNREEIERRIAQAVEVLKSYGVQEVYVFGSTASETMTPTSDIDLAVLGLPPEAYYRAVGETLQVVRLPVDVVPLEGDNALARHLLELRRRGELRRVA